MDKMQFDYSKLKGRIVEKCGSQKVFAEKLGISEATLTSKLSGYTFFNQKEIARSIGILGLEPDELSPIFFAERV